jgi:plasmid stabilization system protein ParE
MNKRPSLVATGQNSCRPPAKVIVAQYLISENDSIGNICDEISPGYRKFSEGSHVIYYRVTDMVEVIRILHERMEPDSHLP